MGGKSHSHQHKSTRNIKVAFFLNLAFTLLEIIGGIWTNSVAILSDAIHDLGDSLSLGMSWYFDKKAKKKGNNKFSFGYQRFSVLGALINCLVLLFGSIFILLEAIPRIIEPEHSNAKGMIVFAIIGVFVNGTAVYKLKSGETLNEKVVSLHLLEDVLGWVAVLIVSIVLLFWDVPILDPLLSILILIYILVNAIKKLRETLLIFLQGVPLDINKEDIEKEIKELDNVESIDQINIWSLDGENHVISIHIRLSVVSLEKVTLIKKDVRSILENKSINNITIEVE